MNLFTSNTPVVYFALILALSAITACANKTRVQLYTQHLSEAEIVKVETLLKNYQYTVIRNDYPIPVGIKANTLIYSPLNKNIDQVNNLAELMSETVFGYPNLELTGKENHFYTNSTMGLYLLPASEIAIRSGINNHRYSNEYNGRCDSKDVALQLSENGELLLSSFEWDEELDRDIETSLKGSWALANNKMYLSLASQAPVAFDIERRIVGDSNGYIEYQLKNDDGVPFYDNCEFRYKELKGSLK